MCWMEDGHSRDQTKSNRSLLLGIVLLYSFLFFAADLKLPERKGNKNEGIACNSEHLPQYCPARMQRWSLPGQ